MGFSTIDNLALKDDLIEEINNYNNVIHVEKHNDTIRKKSSEPTKKNKHSKSTEVYPFKTQEEINAIINMIDKHINEATTEYNVKRWHRNKLLFIIGINLGIRGSDLCELRWCDFFYDDFVFRDGIKIQPIKTKRTGKYVSLFFNNNIKNAITEYIAKYPIDNLEDYVFFSKTTSKKSGNTHIDRITVGRMLKSIAKECGIRQNINSHSLRKTFGYHVWHNAQNKSEALTMLQYIFGHASLRDTQAYIGIQQEEVSKMFDSLVVY